MKKGICMVLACFMLLGIMGVSAQEGTYQIGDLTVPYQQTEAEQLQALGLLQGTENGLELDGAVTRAQAVTMVIRLLGETVDVQENPFEDVRGHWAEAAVAYAAANGYVKGVSETAFEPERGVTGQEFATMLLRAFGYAAEPDTAYEMGIAAGMLLNNYTKTAVELADYALIRSDLASICCGALLAKTADGEPVQDLLMEKGVFTAEQWASVMTCGKPVPKPENTGFAWKVNEQMPQDQNYMFSPLSIKMAFAMAANGAAGQTQEEILNALEIDDLDAFNAEAAQLIETYNAQDELKLQVANSIWANKTKLLDLDFTESYLKTIEDYYQGTASDVTDADAVETVNNWVSEHTNGKIDSIIDDSDFYALLVNAVYFKGTWAEQFNEGATRPDTFTGRDGTETEIPFMNYTRYMGYYADANTQMVRLPYKGADISMYVALTDQPGSYLEEAVEKMETTRIALSLPKFRVEFSTSLNDIMKALGVQTAFAEEEADFTPMIGEKLLFIDETLHKTYIDVDENGTEAAAVTSISAGATSAPVDEPIEFKADRPFTYFIRDDASGEILFLGQYAYAE